MLLTTNKCFTEKHIQTTLLSLNSTSRNQFPGSPREFCNIDFYPLPIISKNINGMGPTKSIDIKTINSLEAEDYPTPETPRKSPSPLPSQNKYSYQTTHQNHHLRNLEKKTPSVIKTRTQVNSFIIPNPKPKPQKQQKLKSENVHFITISLRSAQLFGTFQSFRLRNIQQHHIHGLEGDFKCSHL